MDNEAGKELVKLYDSLVVMMTMALKGVMESKDKNSFESKDVLEKGMVVMREEIRRHIKVGISPLCFVLGLKDDQANAVVEKYAAAIVSELNTLIKIKGMDGNH